jgi:hypothetical protein
MPVGVRLDRTPTLARVNGRIFLSDHRSIYANPEVVVTPRARKELNCCYLVTSKIEADRWHKLIIVNRSALTKTSIRRRVGRAAVVLTCLSRHSALRFDVVRTNSSGTTRTGRIQVVLLHLPEVSTFCRWRKAMIGLNQHATTKLPVKEHQHSDIGVSWGVRSN